MENVDHSKHIRIAIAGLGNCASSLIESVYYYRQNPEKKTGLLFPTLCGYSVRDIEIIAAFDISALKVGRPVNEAIYQPPNNFVRIEKAQVHSSALVYRGPTLDGNPEHLARLVKESPSHPADVISILNDLKADVLVNLLPTGSIQATEFYSQAALESGCAFINCIPTVLAQRAEVRETYGRKNIPLFGDDIRDQPHNHSGIARALAPVGITWGTLNKTSGSISAVIPTLPTSSIGLRRNLFPSVSRWPGMWAIRWNFTLGTIIDRTKGPIKNAFIEIEASVFGDSPVKISMKLESDDKPNSAGSIADLIRIAKGAINKRMGGTIPEACAFYFKSPPNEMDDLEALDLIRQEWTSYKEEHLYVGEMGTNLG